MFEGLLPIGTVVLLKDSEKRIMITGVLQRQIEGGNEEKIWDYVAVLYPEGAMGPDKTFLFDDEQIEKIYSIGYQDEEQFECRRSCRGSRARRAPRSASSCRPSDRGTTMPRRAGSCRGRVPSENCP